jgi:hypothetical protein
VSLENSAWDEWPLGPIPDTWSVRCQVRAEIDSTEVLAEWDSTDPETLPCGVADGVVTLSVPASVSSAWTWLRGRWDIEVVSPSGDIVLRVDWGTIVVRPEVTR